MPHEANEALHNLSDRHKMSQTARGIHTATRAYKHAYIDAHTHTHTHPHTYTLSSADVVSCKSCLLVRSVFSD